MSVLSITPWKLSEPLPIAKSGTNVPEWFPLAHDTAAEYDTRYFAWLAILMSAFSRFSCVSAAA